MKKIFLITILVLLAGCFNVPSIDSETGAVSETSVVTPKLSNVSSSRDTKGITLSFKNDEEVTIYLLASETKITDANTIKNSATDTQLIPANTLKTYTFTGLDANKQYYLYAVAADRVGNLSDIVEEIVAVPNDTADPQDPPDLIAPILSNVSSSRDLATASLARLSFQSDEAATAYLLASETKITDANAIKNAAAAVRQSILANTLITHDFTGLAADTQYYLYAVAVDSDGNLSNIAEKIAAAPIDPQRIAPILFNISFSRDTTTTSLSFQSDEAATLYFLASETQITDKNAITNAAAAVRQSVLANTPITHNFTGLDADTSYYLYAVAEDADNNISNIAEKWVSSPNDPVTLAFSTGDASAITPAMILDRAKTEKQNRINYCKDTLNFIYPNGLENLAFPKEANTFIITAGKNIPIHIKTTASGNDLIYSIAGEKPDGNRYAILSTNMFAKSGIKTTAVKSTEQIIKWTLKKDVSANIFSENITILANSSSVKNYIEGWLTANGKTASWNITTDRSLVDTGAYDIYIGEHENNLVADYKKVLDAKKPIIFFDHWYHPNDQVLQEFDVKWGWFGVGTTWSSYTDVDNYCDSGKDNYVALLDTIENLEENKLNLKIDSTGCTTSTGKITCSSTGVVDNITSKTMGQMVTDGIDYLRNTVIKTLDHAGENIFDKAGNDILKLAILLGDKYRENINYAFSIWESNQEDFFKAYFGDNAVHTMRPNNAYQTDLGSYIDNPAAQTAIGTIDETLSFTPTAYTEWTSSRVYLLPGKKATIKRTDTTGTTVKIKINFQKTETTRMWNKGSPASLTEMNFSRPRFLMSHTIKLDSGKSYEISNPYGGPIYVELSSSTDASPSPVTIEFKDIAKHPTIDTFDDATIQKFINDVNNSPLDFVDIITPYAEIHMTEKTFIRSLNEVDGNASNGYTINDVQKYINDINDYLIISNYRYAGYLGAGIPARTASVIQTCSDLTITAECNDADIHKKPMIQHVNVDDFAACGDACAGNPFDIAGSMSPISRIANHEMGHNLDVNRFRMYGGISTETSNMIFPYYTHSKYARDKGLEDFGPSPNFETAYNYIQTQIANSASPGSNHPLWVGAKYTNAGHRLSFYLQLIFLNESFDIFTKAHIVNRIVDAKLGSDTDWVNIKDKIGLSSYTKDEAKGLNGNDFMAIMLSKITGKNHVPYFERWGVEVTQKAKDQITANGTPNGSIPLIMYKVRENKIFADIQTNVIDPADTRPLDGTSTW